MKKISVLLFTICLLGVCFYGLSTNSYYVQLLVNLSTPYVYVRIAVVAALVAYAFIPSLRLYVTRALLGFGGGLLLILGLVSLGSPTVLGYASGYTLIGDSLTLIEGGILAIVLSTELSARRSSMLVRSFAYIQSLVVTRPRKLTPSHRLLQSAIILKAQIPS